MAATESPWAKVFFIAYELLWRLLILLLLPIAKRIPSLRSQVEGRSLSKEELSKLAEQRNGDQRALVFFCSSAGEYEQAKPLMDRLQKQENVFVFLLLLSVSGKKFALSQGEATTLHMAPWDLPSVWRKLFKALRPEAFIVVRYELWPGFLWVARSFAPVYLIDAVRSPSLLKNPLSRSLRRWLVGFCRKIFVVGSGDQEFYAELLKRPLNATAVVGDTKYDRVLERLEQREFKRLELQSQLADFIGSGPILILGSAWPRDLEVLLEVFSDLLSLHPSLKLIVAPHDVSPSMVSRMQDDLLKHGLTVCRARHTGLAAAQADDKVLLVDMIGLLPELYALADIAWVGGALHNRVHNVLEPACRGLFVCFGPHYQTSQEARQLVAEGLVEVIESGQQFLDWVRGLHWNGRPPHRLLFEAITRHRGASDRILKAIEADVLSTRS